ncbi:ORF-109 [Buzura suppressaria nucleopolyhedrovirus]|uniref:ORF-109 n=1 Tax=Buzura suppressaria nuclear polyhedrosis virus TaxID=74320 RepID=W5VKV4_NPVBS|nr:ORF-109 [Buzura suppressaria nucleopolyhedrovirus]AHH82698.1 ORF-109 [Buzura suppressaria nucleopolyhedrovirus]AKN91082.1 ORF-112 [Buzura suppressaria nucleopolyhedrovirus]QYF10650.1 hypothetical protein [Buzura suppressaria nucleopolyhedrovirus]
MMNKLKSFLDYFSFCFRRTSNDTTNNSMLHLLLTHVCDWCRYRDRVDMIRTILNKNSDIIKIVHEYSVRSENDPDHRCVFENALIYCYDWVQLKWRDEFLIQLLRANNMFIINMLPQNNSDIDLIIKMDTHRLKFCVEYRLCLHELVKKRYINIR